MKFGMMAAAIFIGAAFLAQMKGMLKGCPLLVAVTTYRPPSPSDMFYNGRECKKVSHDFCGALRNLTCLVTGEKWMKIAR
ncbi:hypothetical protein VNO77_06098 [Canavalia gladiata]|uniref:Secreted protein n=1 Tax=Canavalia gladiata TaxID=3824 RepID=A0AAN9RET9_CANGL